jgi:hypothetical protein
MSFDGIYKLFRLTKKQIDLFLRKFKIFTIIATLPELKCFIEMPSHPKIAGFFHALPRLIQSVAGEGHLFLL